MKLLAKEGYVGWDCPAFRSCAYRRENRVLNQQQVKQVDEAFATDTLAFIGSVPSWWLAQVKLVPQKLDQLRNLVLS